MAENKPIVRTDSPAPELRLRYYTADMLVAHTLACFIDLQAFDVLRERVPGLVQRVLAYNTVASRPESPLRRRRQETMYRLACIAEGMLAGVRWAYEQARMGAVDTESVAETINQACGSIGAIDEQINLAVEDDGENEKEDANDENDQEG